MRRLGDVAMVHHFHGLALGLEAGDDLPKAEGTRMSQRVLLVTKNGGAGAGSAATWGSTAAVSTGAKPCFASRALVIWRTMVRVVPLTSSCVGGDSSPLVDGQRLTG